VIVKAVREPLEALRLLQRSESVCSGRVSVVEAMKVSVEAVRVLIKAQSDCRGAQSGCESINTLTASSTLSQPEKVFVNSLLQAKRVLINCRGLQSVLEAVRVSECQ
jgi:hypothetical protein